MRVHLYTPDYPPTLNSASRLSKDLADDLSAAGHVVSVVTRRPERYLAPDAVVRDSGRARVRRLWNMPGPRHIPAARILEQAWTGLSAFFCGLAQGPADAIIVYSPPLPLALAALAVARLRGARCIVNVQDLYPRTAVDLGLLRNRLAIRLAEKLETLLYRHADIVTVHSEGNRAHVVACGGRPESVRVVRNWVDLEELKPGPALNAWRRRHGLDSRFLVTFAGTMGFAQGLEDVLEAAAALKGLEGLTLVLAGDGVLRPRLEREARERGLDHVVFLPPQAPEDYLALLQASDLCLVTLNKKLATPVVPGKLQSVLAAGRPALYYANPASDGRRMVEDADAGTFVPAGDITGLAGAIRAAWADRTRAAAQGASGRRYAELHFGRKEGSGSYKTLIEEKP